MEKASFFLSKIENIENKINDIKAKNPPLYYLLSKQIFKLKKVLKFFLSNDISVDNSFFDYVEFLVKGIENLLLDNSVLENWLKESKKINSSLENFALAFEKDLQISEKIIEIKHILDEVIEIHEILLGKIPD